MEITLSKLLKLVTTHLLIIALCGVLGAFAGLGYTTFFVDESYSSTIKLMVISPDKEITDIASQRRAVNSYIAMLDSRDFYAEVAEQTGMNVSGSYIGSMLDYESDSESEAFSVTITAPTATECQIVAATFQEMVPQKISNAFLDATLNIVEHAYAPVRSGSNRNRNMALGLFVGCALCVGILLIRDLLDVRVKSEEDLAQRYTVPVLGCVPDFVSSGSTKNKVG